MQDTKWAGAITTGQRPGVDASQCRKCGARRVDSQLGLEKTPEEYVAKMVEVFREVKRVLRADGTFWLNIGDSYFTSPTGSLSNKPSLMTGGRATQREGTKRPSKLVDGCKPKDLVGIPWLLAFALRADGWYWRSTLPWIKRNAMPESCKDRPGQSVEQVLMFSKSQRYYFDMDAVRVAWADDRQGRDGSPKPSQRNRGGRTDGYTKPNGVDPSANGGRNLRNHDFFMRSWQGMMMSADDEPLAIVANPKPFRGAHFAVFPPSLVEPVIKASTSEKGCCAKCGIPQQRIIERSNQVDITAKGSYFDRGKTVARDGGERTQRGERYCLKSVGWQSACTCDTGIVSCTVLDPFAGAGTTGVVCYQLDRDFIGIELNPEYVDMIENRLVAEATR